MEIELLPIDDNSFLLRLGVRDQHICDQEPINRRRAIVQENLHLQRRSWTDVQLSGDEIATLPDADSQYRYRCRLGDLSPDVDHAAGGNKRRRIKIPAPARGITLFPVGME